MTTIKSFLEGRPYLLAYLLITVLMVISFIRLEDVNRQVADTSERRVRVACAAVESSREIIRDIVFTLAPGDLEPIPEDIDPALREIIESSRERNNTLRRQALEILDGTECSIVDQERLP